MYQGVFLQHFTKQASSPTTRSLWTEHAVLSFVRFGKFVCRTCDTYRGDTQLLFGSLPRWIASSQKKNMWRFRCEGKMSGSTSAAVVASACLLCGLVAVLAFGGRDLSAYCCANLSFRGSLEVVFVMPARDGSVPTKSHECDSAPCQY